jgi:hypothetical protein
MDKTIVIVEKLYINTILRLIIHRIIICREGNDDCFIENSVTVSDITFSWKIILDVALIATHSFHSQQLEVQI